MSASQAASTSGLSGPVYLVGPSVALYATPSSSKRIDPEKRIFSNEIAVFAGAIQGR